MLVYAGRPSGEQLLCDTYGHEFQASIRWTARRSFRGSGRCLASPYEEFARESSSSRADVRRVSAAFSVEGRALTRQVVPAKEAQGKAFRSRAPPSRPGRGWRSEGRPRGRDHPPLQEPGRVVDRHRGRRGNVPEEQRVSARIRWSAKTCASTRSSRRRRTRRRRGRTTTNRVHSSPSGTTSRRRSGRPGRRKHISEYEDTFYI